MPVACPQCGSRNLRPAKFRNKKEKRASWRFIMPLRCRDCRSRFVAQTLILKDFFYARCPKCDRMDLNGWSGKSFQPSSWTRFKMMLGAHKWRCEYCRVNFASFRKRFEPFSFSRWKKMNPDRVAEKPAESAPAQAAPQPAEPESSEK